MKTLLFAPPVTYGVLVSLGMTQGTPQGLLLSTGLGVLFLALECIWE